MVLSTYAGVTFRCRTRNFLIFNNIFLVTIEASIPKKFREKMNVNITHLFNKGIFIKGNSHIINIILNLRLFKALYCILLS